MRIRAGFTLVELLIVLAISLSLLGVIGTIASNTYPKSQLNAEAGVVMQAIREAQALTLARKEDSRWGVYRTANELILFAGPSYATRDEAFDRTHVFPSGITASGMEEIVFSSLLGTIPQPGTITLTSNATGESVVISINANGVVQK